LAANRAAPWLVALAAVLCLAIAVRLVVSSGTPAAPLEAELPTIEPVTNATPETSEPVELYAHVAGAVVSPGLIRLDQGARVADAIDDAGGPDDDADLDRVNLAAVVSDGDRILVPRIGEPAPALIPGPNGTEATSSVPLDLNTATATELETLPGVGPATAAAIVAHRSDHGRFTTVGALENVPGIGPAKLAQLRELVTAS